MASEKDVPGLLNLTNTSMHCLSPQMLVASILPPILILEMIVGLPCNLLALWIFCFRLKAWRPNTFFLFNLLLADLFLLVGVPFRIDNLLRGEHWVFRGAWCRINLFMLAVNRSASIAFMTTVGVTRYFKVVHPHHRINRMGLTQGGWLAGLIWTVVVALRVPLLATNLLHWKENNLLCRSFDGFEEPPPGIKLHFAIFLGEFFLPLLMLLFCSARIACILRRRRLDRERKVRRAIRTVAVIVAVFVVCFTPSNVTGLAVLYIKRFRPQDCESFRLVGQLFSLSIGFTYLNSTLDPVIYCFSSSYFRNAVKSLISSLGVLELRSSGRSRHRSSASDG